MNRAVIALFLTPVAVMSVVGAWALTQSPYGIYYFVVIPFVSGVTLLIAFPLFLLFQKANPPRLNWGYAVLGGVVCGACFAAIDTPTLDSLISSTNVSFVGLGAAIGLAFWWTGIFKNPAFPSVGNKIPLSMVIVLPIAFALPMAQEALQPTFDTGRVISIIDRPTTALPQGHVSVRLSKGAIVQADYDGTWPVAAVDGKCFHLMQRWSTLRGTRIYQLNGPFGGGVNAC